MVGCSTIGMDSSRSKIHHFSHQYLFSFFPFCASNVYCITDPNKDMMSQTALNKQLEDFQNRCTSFFQKPLTKQCHNPLSSSISHFSVQQASNLNSGNPPPSSSSTVTSSTATGTPPTDASLKNDAASGVGPNTTRTMVAHPSNIYTRHAPYPNPHHHPRGARSHHRGSGHPRGEPAPKKTTGIPRDRLILVPKHIPGALKDPTGASVVPRQIA